ncbi:hypothetical protein HMPREF2955_12980 [Prevotella sp. HMSC073D09]|nr:hypothetical protein HMPREF2955_12980 [Prevotella sp. HMSC073D09]
MTDLKYVCRDMSIGKLHLVMKYILLHGISEILLLPKMVFHGGTHELPLMYIKVEQEVFLLRMLNIMVGVKLIPT